MNHAIPYHVDGGNFKSALSNVLILKQNISGGELVLPEYGITLSQRDRALCIFDGQSIIHGVRPIIVERQDQPHYRASIVYYSMHGMRLCLDKKEEYNRLKKIRTEKESRSTEDRNQLVSRINRKLIDAE